MHILSFLALIAVVTAQAVVMAGPQEDAKKEFFMLFRMMAFYIALFTGCIMLISIIFQ